MSGQWISIAAADGNASRAYLTIPGAGHGPGLVVLDETSVHEIADLYAAEGYVVLCPEQLHSHISATMTRHCAHARNAQERSACSASAAAAALAYRAAAEGGIDGAVIYYGAGITKALDPAPRIACPVVMHFAEKDPAVPPDAVARIKEAFAGSPRYRAPCLSRHACAGSTAETDAACGRAAAGTRAFALDRAAAAGHGPALRPRSALGSAHDATSSSTRDVDATMRDDGIATPMSTTSRS